MKKFFTTLAIAASFCVGASAQGTLFDPYISEFLNNDPSGGTGGDSLEFIEIHNPNIIDIGIGGYQLSVGVSYTYPIGTMIPSNGYLIVAKDSAAFFRNFGVTANQWTGGLNNTGEAIVLKNASAIVIDSIDYANADWVSAGVPADDYRSMELCDPSADHALLSSWLPGATPTGVVIAGKEILATPGAANACVPVAPPTFTYYPIGDINGVDANGVLDSLNVDCELRGVVHSEDFRGGAGYDFALIDYTNTGIRIFAPGDINAYVPLRGDSVIVRGTLGQFNGRAEFVITELDYISAANNLVTPRDITGAFDESIEGSLVRINNVTVVDTPTNTASGMTVRFTDGTNTYDVRIDADIDAFTANFTATNFNIIGVGGQFDSSNPYDTGYQIFPRNILDFEELAVGVNNVANEDMQVNMFPNPTTGNTNVRASFVVEQVVVTDVLGRTVAQFQPMSAQFSFDAEWAAGLYQITLLSAKGNVTKQLSVGR